jgi:Trk K+ transport system NAD-binding subunit
MINNKQIKEINRLPESTVLLHCIGDHIQIPPSPDAVISIGDEIVVLTSRQELNNLRFL